MSPARLRGLLLAVALVGVAGCGYHLVGTGSSYLPEDLDTLYVVRFTDTTGRADLDQRLTEAVSQEWVRRRRFTLVDSPDGAELVLAGTITSIGVQPVTFDDRGRATEYQVTMSAKVALEDRTGDEPELLWEDAAFSRRTSYEVETTALDYFDRQTEAVERLSEEFAQALVSAVLEGF